MFHRDRHDADLELCRDQELRFTVRDSPDYLTLKISVFNDDKKTELIGESFLRLDDVVVAGGGEAELWHSLTCRGKYAGEIRLELTYYDSRPKVEKPVVEKRRERSQTESPGVAGPRQTPVKRRPLPSDPNSAHSTPEPEREHVRPLPGSEHGQYQTPSRHSHYSDEHTLGSMRRTAYNQHQPISAPERQPSGQFQHDDHVLHEDPFTGYPPQPAYGSPQANSPHDRPLQQSQTSVDTSYGSSELAVGRRQSNVSQTPYPLHDGPPVVSLDELDHSRRGIPPLSHSTSEPLVPHFQYDDPRHALHHTVSESHVYDLQPYQHGARGTLDPHIEGEYYDEPNHYAVEDESQSPSHTFQHQTPYNYMQPSVEDEEPPPPPPTHRNSAPSSVSRPRGSFSSYHADAPAPLNISSARRAAPAHHASSPLAPRSENIFGQPDTTHLPHHQALSQDSRYNTPERRGSEDAMLYAQENRDPFDMSSKAYSSPPDAQRRLTGHVSRMSMSQQIASSPASSIRASPYQTPPRGVHPLANQQSATYGSSPSAPLRFSPADVPLIRPRPVSPAAESHHNTAPQPSRPAVRVNMVRKSVPVRPASRDTEVTVPFGPDSFDAFNPNARKPAVSNGGSTYSTPPRSQHGSVGGDLQLDQSIRQSPYNEVDATDGDPIHDLHGNVIDPSDRLPVDSWAPEPERKGFSFKPQITARERERLTGARSMGNSPSSSFLNGDSPNELNGSFSMSTRSDISSQVSAGSSLLATVGSNRNKLQKKSRPQSEYTPQQSQLHGPGQSAGAGNYPYVNNSKRASYDVRAGGAGELRGVPPVPAKIPLDNTERGIGDLSGLDLELASIDIGPSNAMVRRPRRLGY